MPLLLGRMARNQTFRTVPAARSKLLASALVTVFIVALPLPILAVYGLMGAADPHGPVPTAAQLARFHAGLVQTFWMSTGTSILVAGWLYLVLWFITSQRNIAGILKGLAVIAIVMFLPTRNIVEPAAQARWTVTVCALNVLGFSVLFLIWPQLRPIAGRVLGSAERSQSLRVNGREIDLLLGTANPWLLAFGQLVPALLATRIGFYSAAVWLYYLTIFSTVCGAMQGRPRNAAAPCGSAATGRRRSCSSGSNGHSGATTAVCSACSSCCWWRSGRTKSCPWRCSQRGCR